MLLPRYSKQQLPLPKPLFTLLRVTEQPFSEGTGIGRRDNEIDPPEA